MVGKWNKSVILTYIGMSLGVTGIGITMLGNIKYAFICLMFAGICDLFDGTVARRCKRTKEEKVFGIELDSLVDVLSFIALPVVILIKLDSQLYFLPIMILYTIFGIARLAYFNINAPSNNKPVPYYEGLPVTYAALIFPLLFLLSYIIKKDPFVLVYNLFTVLVAILFILKVKVPKPKLVSSIILFIISILVTIIYLVI